MGLENTVHWRELFTPRHWRALVVVCLGVWLHAADALVVATLMPAIVADIGGASLIHWSITLYEIGSIVVATASGLLVMRYGLRVPMSLAASAFAAGCLLSALATHMSVLLLGRLLQGLGGGGMMAMSFVAVGTLFPRRLTARVMAAVSTLWGMSAFVGPVLGGLMVEYATWRLGFAAFALQAAALAIWVARQQTALAAGGVSAVTAPVHEHDDEAAGQRFPFVTLAWLSIGISLIAGSASLPHWTATLLMASLGALGLWKFLELDGRQSDARLLPRQPFSLANPIGAALLLVLCFAGSTIAITLYGPLFMTGIYGASALTTGLILATESVAWTITAVAVSGQPERFDTRWIGVGLLIVAIGVIGLTWSVPYGGLWLITIFAVLQGAGFGLAWTFLLRQATSLAPEGETERVSGAIPTVHSLGFALGAAIIGIVANLAGLSAEASVAARQGVALWVFSAGLPVLLLGTLGAWRFISYLNGSARPTQRMSAPAIKPQNAPPIPSNAKPEPANRNVTAAASRSDGS